VNNEFNDLMEKIIAFRDARNWAQFHNPKDLALSISLEANELLENYQWSSNEEALSKLDNIKEELADVLIYCFLFANEYDLDIKEIMLSKLDRNNQKYPVDKAYNSKKKYNQ